MQRLGNPKDTRFPYGRAWLVVLVLSGAWYVSGATAQTPTQTPGETSPPITAASTSEPQSADPETSPAPPKAAAQIAPSATPGDATAVPAPPVDAPAAAERTPKAPQTYGLFVLVPALVAILFAIFTRQVIPALFLGLLAGAYMMVPCLPNADALTPQNGIVAGFRLGVERYILGSLLDSDQMMVVVFTLMIGFMVGVIGANGGTAGLVNLVSGKTNSPRRGALTAWAAGLVVFFDDYANSMIVGPTMQSVFDRLKLSRAKLAYIVDSTAAPVASLALIGTWVGAEIGFINDGLSEVTASTAPAFLLSDSGQVMSGMSAFIQSLPYRFYPILALFLVFLSAATGRDFGPMKKSQSRAVSKLDAPLELTADAASPVDSEEPKPRWWLGLGPVLVLVVATVAVLVGTGLNHADTIAAMKVSEGPDAWEAWPLWQQASKIMGNGSSYLSIYYGAFLAVIVAMLLTLVARAGTVRHVADAGLDGMTRMFPAIVILVLAWSLSSVQKDLELGQIVTTQLQDMKFPIVWAPLAIFISAALISFATGSSWTTMGLLCPATVQIMIGLSAADTGLDAVGAQHLFFAAVGSVLAGSIFGDHCSPISDTTVLSSIASGCPHEEHVWTQIPYALITAVAAMGLGDVMCSVYHQPWYYGLGAGALFLLVFIFVVGRPAKASLAFSADSDYAP